MSWARASTWALVLTIASATGCRQASEAPPNRELPKADSRIVVLSEEVLRAAGVKVVPVSREAFHPHVVASGVIKPDAQKSVAIRARVAGRIVQVLADVGQRVKAGQSLALIEGPEVTAALSRHRTAAARAAASRKASERAERLLELKAMSRAEVEARKAEAEATEAEAGAARQDLARLGLNPDSVTDSDSPSQFSVPSPLAGVVLERAISPGLLVEKDAALFTIADLSRVWAVADVYEKDLGQIQEEGDVEVATDAYPGEVFTGRIALIEPALDESSRTAHVRIVLDNRSGKLRPGLFVTVAVPLRGASEIEATAVPAGAVQKISSLPVVFVQVQPGRFELRPVETGREAHGMIEIRHGLHEGEQVVAEGAFVLKSELLKGTIEGED
ncbi:MAG TPA: efflux RND transporter periplasmic adaptor subunit [Candidatus Polarisedimenticolia bacterium]|nr:efflux RND transporter periplasmic adaptor subunit [Candidatus Polarisedimenticolia bacterium]